jgi:hypothetical protein
MTKNIEPRVILLDFDGTLAFHDFPALGDEVPDAIPIVKRLQDAGHKLILHTCRSGMQLDEAVEWCRNRDIVFFAVNENPDFETGSRKVYSHLEVDDHSLGVPLTYNPEVHKKPFVNWHRVREWLLINKYI